jgi:hypothetical protein
MSIVVLRLSVGRQLSLADAVTVTAAAEAAGITAIRLADDGLDPTVVAAYLAGRHPRIGYLPEIATTHQAPYNVARRVQSLDRATAGWAGAVLRPGAGDEVSDAPAPDPTATDPVARWIEYAEVLTRLWQSFPAAALVGDQRAAVAVDDTLIHPIDYRGRFYRVAGPIDGPATVHGRPVLAADLGVLGANAVVGRADVVVLDREHRSAAADLRLAGLTVLARVTGTERPAWATGSALDGVELVPDSGVDAAIAALRSWPARRVTCLREALGVPG